MNNITEKTMSRRQKFFKRCWIVLVPAIALNAVLALDYVVARQNEAIRVSLKAGVLAAMRAQQDEPLSETLRAHWITTNDDGNLEGRISAIEPTQSITIPIEQLDVTLLKKGQKIAEATTDGNGRFVLPNVESGVYTLVAAGQSGFLAYGVHVLPKLEQIDGLDFDARNATPADRKAFYVSHFRLPAGAEVQEDLQIDAACVPPEFSTLKQISQNYISSDAALSIGQDTDDVKAIGRASEIKGGHQFELTPDGTLVGRIQPIATEGGEPAKLSDMNIFLLQDDIEVSRVAVEPNGKFEIEDVEPGVYAIVAAGQDGFAALSIELVAASPEEISRSSSQPSIHHVSYRPQDVPVSLGIAIVSDPDDLKFISQEVERAAELNEAPIEFADVGPIDGGVPGQGGTAAPGGFEGGIVSDAPFFDPGPVGGAPAFDGGPAFGGGPGFGGGGGFGNVLGGRGGSILAIAGGAAGIVAIAVSDDDDDDDGDPPPASPATTVDGLVVF